MSAATRKTKTQLQAELATAQARVRELEARQEGCRRLLAVAETQRGEFQVLSSRYQAILAAVPDIVMEVDQHKVYTWANAAGFFFFGDGVLGREAAFYFEGDQDTYEIVSPVFEGCEDVIYVESWQRRCDGEKRLLAWWCHVLKDETGAVTGALSTARDVTEQRAVGQALRESEERFRAIFEQAAVGVALIETATGRFVRVNRRYADIVGFRLDEMTETTFMALTHPDDLPLDLDYMARLTHGEIREFTMEERYFHRNGGVVWVDLTVSPMWRPGETPDYHIAVVEDITARKHAEEALQRRTDELALLGELGRRVSSNLDPANVMEAALAGLAEAFPDDEVLLYLRENDRLLLRGTRASGKAGLHPPGNKRVGVCLCGLAAESATAVYAKDILSDPRCTLKECKEAGIRSFAALPLCQGGDVLGVLGLAARTPKDYGARAAFLETVAAEVAVSIGNALLHEQILRQARDLEARVAERTVDLEEFAYSVSHDLRAPLRAINGFASILIERRPDGLDARAQHYLDNIAQSAGHMGRLIDDLLRYSRIGRQAVTPAPVPLQGVVDRVLSELRARAEEARARIVVADGLPAVLGNLTLLEQIFSNLIDNALTYVGAGRAPEIAVSWTADGDDVFVRVTDNGIGIEPRFQPKVFQVFQRLHTDDDYPGTGVGLAIVKKAVSLLGGDAGVESKPGLGSTFWVRLRSARAFGEGAHNAR